MKGSHQHQPTVAPAADSPTSAHHENREEEQDVHQVAGVDMSVLKARGAVSKSPFLTVKGGNSGSIEKKSSDHNAPLKNKNRENTNFNTDVKRETPAISIKTRNSDTPAESEAQDKILLQEAWPEELQAERSQQEPQRLTTRRFAVMAESVSEEGGLQDMPYHRYPTLRKGRRKGQDITMSGGQLWNSANVDGVDFEDDTESGEKGDEKVKEDVTGKRRTSRNWSQEWRSKAVELATTPPPVLSSNSQESVDPQPTATTLENHTPQESTPADTAPYSGKAASKASTLPHATPDEFPTAMAPSTWSVKRNPFLLADRATSQPAGSWKLTRKTGRTTMQMLQEQFSDEALLRTSSRSPSPAKLLEGTAAPSTPTVTTSRVEPDCSQTSPIRSPFGNVAALPVQASLSKSFAQKLQRENYQHTAQQSVQQEAPGHLNQKRTVKSPKRGGIWDEGFWANGSGSKDLVDIPEQEETSKVKQDAPSQHELAPSSVPATNGTASDTKRDEMHRTVGNVELHESGNGIAENAARDETVSEPTVKELPVVAQNAENSTPLPPPAEAISTIPEAVIEASDIGQLADDAEGLGTGSTITSNLPIDSLEKSSVPPTTENQSSSRPLSKSAETDADGPQKAIVNDQADLAGEKVDEQTATVLSVVKPIDLETPSAPDVLQVPASEQCPNGSASIPSTLKTKLKRIWSPSRLQVPSLAIGSLFEDSDWVGAFMGSGLGHSLSGGHAAEKHREGDNVAVARETKLSETIHIREEVGEARPLLYRRDSLGQVTPITLASTIVEEDVSTLDTTSEEPAATQCSAGNERLDAEGHPPRLIRTDSLASLVDVIIGPTTIPGAGQGAGKGVAVEGGCLVWRDKKRKGRKRVTFGRAWKGEFEKRRIFPAGRITLTSQGGKQHAQTQHPDGRTGVLYLKIHRMENIEIPTDQDVDITINIKQDSADRTYQWETTVMLAAGETVALMEFECEIPLLPTHPMSFMVYLKARPLVEAQQGSSGTSSNLSSYTTGTSLNSSPTKGKSKREDSEKKRAGFLSLFRGGSVGSGGGGKKGTSVKEDGGGSVMKGIPHLSTDARFTSNSSSSSINSLKPAQSSPIPPSSQPPIPPFSLLVAESKFDASMWTDATGTLHTHVFPCHTLQWEGGLVHGDRVGDIVCDVGYLPFMDELDYTLLPQSYDEYDLHIRILEWNDAPSMEGHLYQLGADVQEQYERRYYKLKGSTLHVYTADQKPHVVHNPWPSSQDEPIEISPSACSPIPPPQNASDTNLTTATPIQALPRPLEQSHGEQILKMDLGMLDRWGPYTPNARVRTRSDEVLLSTQPPPLAPPSSKTATTSLQPPDPSTSLILSFRDGREVVLAVDPADTAIYQSTSDSLNTAQESAQPRQIWQAQDLAEMWHRALNEVINGSKYEVPLWTKALESWRARVGKSETQENSRDAAPN
ncbi:hypothetical protein DFS34DRAFT_594150 [Phlyctochytrium arcticum]|nr:hypothetical protein DFS34DRAFT_594150 [Phlyctochytrium arcticum]